MHVGDFRIGREFTFGARRQQVDRNNGTTNGSNEQSLWRPHYEPLYKLDGLIALSGGYRLLESLRGVYIVAQNAEWKSHFGNTGGAGAGAVTAGAVPEPAGLLAGIGMLAAIGSRRRSGDVVIA